MAEGQVARVMERLKQKLAGVEGSVRTEPRTTLYKNCSLSQKRPLCFCLIRFCVSAFRVFALSGPVGSALSQG
eukprot:SAG22_NODE_6658_length_826_cov_0.852820_1_plen_72_part_10